MNKPHRKSPSFPALVIGALLAVAATIPAWAGTPAPAASGKPVDLHLFAPGNEWKFVAGVEFPGAAGDFHLAMDGKEAIGVLEYNFDGGGAYVAGLCPGVVIQEGTRAVQFQARCAQPMRLSLRLGDATHQLHQTDVEYTDAGRWQTFTVDLKTPARLHFGGANDGEIHYPIQGLLLNVNHNKALSSDTGQVEFKGVSSVK